MTKLLYWRLAFTNLWKNRKTYLPFVVAGTVLAFCLYSFCMIANDPGIRNMPGSAAFSSMMMLGMVVVGLFSAIFLSYANGFLIKRRKTEMGLYGVLGMEKKHISRVMRHELTLCYLLNMLFGLSIGIVLARLMFMLVRLIIRVEVPLVGSVSTPSLLMVAGLFAAVYVIMMLYNSWQVRAASPIELLRGSQVGEREPKSRWVLSIFGLLCMGGGYAIAQMVQNPALAIGLFFVAVILVIAGTYCLFIAGSLTVLKLMKRRKNFYYRSRNFVTISGMLYRMKQNAAGLAGIAILCTMAMVTVGTTVSLYFGGDYMLDAQYPTDFQVRVEDEETLQFAENLVVDLAQSEQITLEGKQAYSGYSATATIEETILRPTVDADRYLVSVSSDLNHMADVFIVTQDMHNQLKNSPVALAENEMLWYSGSPLELETVKLADDTYTLQRIEKPVFLPHSMNREMGMPALYLVAYNEETAQRVAQTFNEGTDWHTFRLQFDIAQEDERAGAFLETFMRELGQRGTTLHTYNKIEKREEIYTLYGGFLFVGVFLGALFLMATAMIIYFKQISEGYQDHDRFIILQKVGMSEEEVKRTVKRQILIVFFLPLLVAMCHVAGSLHMMMLQLQAFGLFNQSFIALNTLFAAVGIAALYTLFYLRTAKTYYQLVRF